MKRTYCGEDNNLEPDGSMLSLHFQPDECDSEPSKKLKTMADTTTATVKNESLIQIQEITEPCDNVITQRNATDYSEEPESHIKDGKIILFYFYQIILALKYLHGTIRGLNLMQLNLCIVFNKSLHFSYAK